MLNCLDLISCALVVMFVMLHGSQKRWMVVGVTVLVAGGMLFARQTVWSSLLIAILVAQMVYLPGDNGGGSGRDASPAMSEHFVGSASASEKDSAAATNDRDSNDDNDDGDNDDNDDGDNDDDDGEGGVDMFRTMLESYKSLTPDQVEHMTSDTKELIETQKSLLETVKSLAPVVTQGKEMLDTFKDYFGDDTREMLGSAMKTIGGSADKKAAAKRKKKV